MTRLSGSGLVSRASTQLGTRADITAGGMFARYAVGDIPYTLVKLVVKDPRLCRPTITQISATDRSV